MDKWMRHYHLCNWGKMCVCVCVCNHGGDLVELGLMRQENAWESLVLHSYQYFDHGISSSEGLTKHPLDFNVMCLIRRYREEVRYAVSCYTVNPCGQTWAVLFWGRVVRAKALKTQRETGSKDVASPWRAVHKPGCQPSAAGSTQEWWSLGCWQMPDRPNRWGRGQILPGSYDQGQRMLPMKQSSSHLPAVVTLGTASVLKAERDRFSALVSLNFNFICKIGILITISTSSVCCKDKKVRVKVL